MLEMHRNPQGWKQINSERNSTEFNMLIMGPPSQIKRLYSNGSSDKNMKLNVIFFMLGCTLHMTFHLDMLDCALREGWRKGLWLPNIMFVHNDVQIEGLTTRGSRDKNKHRKLTQPNVSLAGLYFKSECKYVVFSDHVEKMLHITHSNIHL